MMKGRGGLCVTQLGPGKKKDQENEELRATPAPTLVCVPPLSVPAQVADWPALPILEEQTGEADLCPTDRISLWFIFLDFVAHVEKCMNQGPLVTSACQHCHLLQPRMPDPLKLPKSEGMPTLYHNCTKPPPNPDAGGSCQA